MQRGRKADAGAVAEDRSRANDRTAVASGECKGSIPRDLAQRENNALPFEQTPFIVEERAAVGDLLWKRLVRRRRAPRGGADVAVGKGEPIAAALAGGLIRQAAAMQGGEEEIARAISGEHSSGAIGAMGGGGEADDPDPRIWIAKAGNGFAPVVPFDESAAFFLRDIEAVIAQPRTTGALDNGAMKLEK